MKQARFLHKFVIATATALVTGVICAQTTPFFFGGNHASTYCGVQGGFRGVQGTHYLT